MADKLPEVVVFAGPNGSGKSTITEILRPIGIDYINADDIKASTGCTDLEAAQRAEARRERHLAGVVPFCFETVMSTRRNLDLLIRAKDAGFFIRAYIILTVDSSINVARVRGRVEAGGHDVPEDKIVSRYARSLALVKEAVAVSDVCNIYDNSFDYPVRIFNQKPTDAFYEEAPLWGLDAIKKLTGIREMRYRDLNANNPFAKGVRMQ